MMELAPEVTLTTAVGILGSCVLLSLDVFVLLEISNLLRAAA